jgi:hypothetical protein
MNNHTSYTHPHIALHCIVLYTVEFPAYVSWSLLGLVEYWTTYYAIYNTLWKIMGKMDIPSCRPIYLGELGRGHLLNVPVTKQSVE